MSSKFGQMRPLISMATDRVTNFKYMGIFRLISVFQTTAMLKVANSQHYPPAPFARFIGSLMML